jgi:DUF1680 family protein
MHPRLVAANEQVEADKGRVAVERGPIVYCAEWPDNDFSVRNVTLDKQPTFVTAERPELLNGLTELRTTAIMNDGSGKEVSLTLIPYYAWCHRGSGEMLVWLPKES